jgi:enhancer of polycomb-like protein
MPGLRIKTNDLQRPLLRPKERITQIREQVDQTLARQKDLDHHWEDQIDVSVFFRVFFPSLTNSWN